MKVARLTVVCIHYNSVRCSYRQPLGRTYDKEINKPKYITVFYFYAWVFKHYPVVPYVYLRIRYNVLISMVVLSLQL